MNENDISTDTIRQLLNRSSSEIGHSTLAHLRDARAQALARYDARSTAPAFSWAGFGSIGSGHAAGSQRSNYYWVAAVLLALTLISTAAYWKHTEDRDVSDVDIAILTDDLPIEMYVD